MTIYEIVPATEEHVCDLAPRLRMTDSLTVIGLDPTLTLRKYVSAAEEAVAGLADGQVVVLFGVTKRSLLDEGVHVWLFGDHAIPKHAMKLAREAKKWIAKARERYDSVFTYVDVAHPNEVRWVGWLGFRAVSEVFAGDRKFVKMDLV